MCVESVAGHGHCTGGVEHAQLWGAVYLCSALVRQPPQCFWPVLQISIEPTFHSVDDAAVDISDSLISVDNDGQVTVGGGGGSSGGGARPTG